MARRISARNRRGADGDNGRVFAARGGGTGVAIHEGAMTAAGARAKYGNLTC